MNNITVVIGDWSNDGHGQTETYHLQSNYSIDKIKTLIKEFQSKFGFDPTDKYCCNYQESYLTLNDIEELIPILGKDYFKYYNKIYDVYHLDTLTYTALVFDLLKTIDFEFEYEIIKDRTNRLTIGGYGLFGD
jgi:hypothetical protein